jgi:hypothetical protein
MEAVGNAPIIAEEEMRSTSNTCSSLRNWGLVYRFMRSWDSVRLPLINTVSIFSMYILYTT